jgi:hypothetical protein
MNSPISITGKAHQRKIREAHAASDPLLAEKAALATSFSNAEVREINYATAKGLIEQYEWLGNMGTTDFSFGLYFGEHLAGVVCFGRTAGTKTAASVCGPEYASMVKTLCRGACVHWAHPHSASFLISRACRLMSEKGFHIFVAYSDAEAGEIGTVYQASNWLHCEPTTSGASMFVWAGKRGAAGTFYDGKLRDERNIHHAIRSRRFKGQPIAPYQIKCTRREAREKMVKEGFLFFKAIPKRRYVTFCGDKTLERELRAALKWQVLPYPKRVCGGSVQGEHPDTIGKGVVRIHTSAPNLEGEHVRGMSSKQVSAVELELYFHTIACGFQSPAAMRHKMLG